MIHVNDRYWWLALLAVVGLIVFTYFYYRRTIPPLKKTWRIGLGLVRSLALVLLLLALTETLLSLSPEMADPPIIAVIVDGSASMYVRDGNAPAIAQAKRHWQDAVKRLPREAQPVQFFAAESLLADGKLPDSGGTATALGTSLAALKRKFESKNLAAVILFSDGNNNLGPDPAQAAADLKIPVIAVGIGQPDSGLAPTVVAVDVDEVVLANRPFTIKAGVTARRAGNIRLRLMRGSEKVEEKPVDIAAPGQRAEITFETSVPTAGMHHFRVEPVAVPEAGRSFFVKALKEKARVLLYGFRPDWEFAFLKRTLEAIPDVEIRAVMTGPGGKALLDPPPMAAEWPSYDAVILVGPDDRWLKSTWAPVAKDLMHSGKGLMILLGERTFAPALQTLPYPLDFLRGSPVWKRGEFSVSPEPASMRHPLLRLEESPEDARRVFESFPPFTGMWEISTLPEHTAMLLSFHPAGFNTPDTRTIPLVWTSREGGGKALVVNGGPLWRWSFNSSVEPKATNYYARFLGLAIRWLTVTEDLQKQRIETDKQVYASGEPIYLRGFLYDDGYRFLSRASVVARVWPDSGSSTADSATIFLPPGSGDFYAGVLTRLKPGLYNFAGSAALDGDTLKLAGGKLKVELTSLEMSASGLDEQEMRAIALKSGGRYYHESEPIAVLDSLTLRSRTYTIHHEIEIWNQSWLLIAILVLLSGEWFFRKRRQLL